MASDQKSKSAQLSIFKYILILIIIVVISGIPILFIFQKISNDWQKILVIFISWYLTIILLSLMYILIVRRENHFFSKKENKKIKVLEDNRVKLFKVLRLALKEQENEVEREELRKEISKEMISEYFGKTTNKIDDILINLVFEELIQKNNDTSQ